MTYYKLNTGETLRVTEINQASGPPVQAIYTFEITDGRCKGQELRLTEREMVLNGAKKL